MVFLRVQSYLVQSRTNKKDNLIWKVPGITAFKARLTTAPCRTKSHMCGEIISVTLAVTRASLRSDHENSYTTGFAGHIDMNIEDTARRQPKTGTIVVQLNILQQHLDGSSVWFEKYSEKLSSATLWCSWETKSRWTWYQLELNLGTVINRKSTFEWSRRAEFNIPVERLMSVELGDFRIMFDSSQRVGSSIVI
ncbi:hypothetical protein B0H17DRAFT_1147137 [Mycena rosella]|uniref:Uncharacterized protein n=1 Tax=Mycena rosella TaxID=1033263 RepID=A0AAD7CN50_MYCRO|nr:hypothetical protein B0H17DRAFT_1147137 [Mycena rosella]